MLIQNENPNICDTAVKRLIDSKNTNHLMKSNLTNRQKSSINNTFGGHLFYYLYLLFIIYCKTTCIPRISKFVNKLMKN